MKNGHTLIVGGTRGLGLEIAKTLASENHLVSVIGRRAIAGKISNVLVWQSDLSDRKNTEKTLDDILKTAGSLNHIIFCQRFRGTGDDWSEELNVSLTVTKNIIEKMKDKFEKGKNNSIVAVSSIIAKFIGVEQPLSYHVAKAGLESLIRYYAATLGPQGIRVNSVSPGTFIKEESRRFYESDSKLQELYKKITPLGRMNTAKDIANVVSFLVSEKSAFVTGINIVVDGGISLHSHETMSRNLINYKHPNIKDKK